MPGEQDTDQAFAARCLLRGTRWASLATQHGGQPFASLVTHAVAPDGGVLLLLSALSAHTRHLAAEPRCALLVCGPPQGVNPQTAPRLTLTGRADLLPDPTWRRFWLDRHPYAAAYAGFTDFGLWRIRPDAGHFVAGFARAHSLNDAELRPSANALEALRQTAPGLLDRLNAQDGAAARGLARQAGLTGDWRAFGLDLDGLDLAGRDEVVRIAFDYPVADAAGLHAALALTQACV